MKHFTIWILTVVLCVSLPCLQGSVFFPTNSAYGIFAAIAVPLDLPHRNVFISYNFEANYNLPTNWGIPPYATGIEDEDLFDDVVEGRRDSGKSCTTNCTISSQEDIEGSGEDDEKQSTESPIESTRNSTESWRRKRAALPSLLTRTHFYRILIDKFERSGFEGEPCLLRLICETNSSELGDINGVLGSLIHIMFSPTTSRNENLPLKYYQAEVDGIYDQCHHYEEECTESILDLISTPLHEIIDNMLTNKI
ncbi:uncharacterized protein LOC142240688 [Haematobia irritans]|uniref:uncharacterized protein LOC142240688 n=1 Tax=Haematobia irritans TaxID=7368 RepID=UPI003F4F7A67